MEVNLFRAQFQVCAESVDRVVDRQEADAANRPERCGHFVIKGREAGDAAVIQFQHGFAGLGQDSGRNSSLMRETCAVWKLSKGGFGNGSWERFLDSIEAKVASLGISMVPEVSFYYAFETARLTSTFAGRAAGVITGFPVCHELGLERSWTVGRSRLAILHSF